MCYVVTILFILLVCFLVLRLRFRVELSDTRRLLFFGIGRSGVQVDYVADVTRVRLFGMTVRTMPRGETGATGLSEESTPISATAVTKKEVEKKGRGSGRRRALHIREWLEIGSRSLRAIRMYVADLFRAIIVEEAEAEIRAGFESPNLTGEAYGYYHALIGAVPSLAARLRFYPDWMGKSFAGSARLSLAIPMYALLYRTALMIFRMPIVKTIRLVREQRKGAAYAR